MHDLMTLRMRGPRQRLNFAELELAYERQLAAHAHMTTENFIRKIRLIAMKHGEYYPDGDYMEL
jgi:hypothetical protein